MSKNKGGFNIEVHEISSSGGRTKVGAGTTVANKTAEQMDEAIGVAKQVAGQAAQQLQTMDHRPDEVQLKLGLKFVVEAGVIIAKTSTEGNLEITLTWKRLPQQV
jgi:uncharacterized protein YfcZ (UPF0381/DUF406 family)